MVEAQVRERVSDVGGRGEIGGERRERMGYRENAYRSEISAVVRYMVVLSVCCGGVVVRRVGGGAVVRRMWEG